jgi:hypothetical protein
MEYWLQDMGVALAMKEGVHQVGQFSGSAIRSGVVSPVPSRLASVENTIFLSSIFPAGGGFYIEARRNFIGSVS